MYFAFDSLDVRPRKQAGIIRALEPEVDNYTGAAPGTVYAGAVGKLLTRSGTSGSSRRTTATAPS